MNRKNGYKNLDKYKETKRLQRNRYYEQFDKYPITPFTPEQDELILKHDIPDRELSAQIKQSVKRIQVRRNKLKNNGGELIWK